MKKIGIDARFYSPTATGIGRHVFELVQHLAKLDKDNQYTVFLQKKDFDNFISPAENFVAEVADYAHYSVAEQTLFLRKINKHKFDLMIFPHFNVPIFYRGKFIVTIHDLTIHLIPGRKSNQIKFWLYKKIIHSAAHNAVKILAVSKNTQKDIVEILDVPNSKIEIVGNGISQSFCDVGDFDRDKFLEKYHLPQKYFLYTGVFREHKNILNLVRAFAIFARQNKEVDLVLAGPLDDLYVPEIKSLADDLGVGDRVHWTGFFPEADFGKLFAAAEAFVFPSFYEGFGVPPLEAMVCGIPTIVSNTSSLPEVCGDASLYFDPRDIGEMAGQMENVLDGRVRLDLVKKGKENVNKFSWEKMAGIYYAEVLEGLK